MMSFWIVLPRDAGRRGKKGATLDGTTTRRQSLLKILFFATRI